MLLPLPRAAEPAAAAELAAITDDGERLHTGLAEEEAVAAMAALAKAVEARSGPRIHAAADG